MTTASLSVGPRVRRITLDAAGHTLSALLSTPEDMPPRATVVALHGAGMSAEYFDGGAQPDASLCALGARLGFAVLAVDRPGYGDSAAGLPEGLGLAGQARVLRAALDHFRGEHHIGTGTFLLAHSFGGKLALTLAAEAPPSDLLGLDISGCGHRYAPLSAELLSGPARARWRYNWGRLALYPPATFRRSAAFVRPIPEQEVRAAPDWPEVFDTIAPRVRVPVRLTFAEHELWWRHDADTLDDLRARLSAAPRVVVDRQPDAGHNISLGHTARAYHLRALAFIEECLPDEYGP
ncbi:alpha/beta hydrolase family protein [Streptomyces sp. NBC_00459]|uniref:alpha/beta hydrolase family protein n=1 Tax=Streptomyces sp. NBC_00459 TaxID=2975749 RepID=UPI002E1807F6